MMLAEAEEALNRDGLSSPVERQANDALEPNAVADVTVKTELQENARASTIEALPSESSFTAAKSAEMSSFEHVNEAGNSDSTSQKQLQQTPPHQAGPLIDLLGMQLLSLERIDETHAQLKPHLTNEVLQGKQVIGLYFSADWCGPCRQFTPELVTFYDKINARKGKKNQFQIVWVSRCRDMESYGQYFTKMPGWLALPPQEALGERGKWLAEKYKVKGIPSLVLVDDMGQVITMDARNKVPADRAGIGFPWRNPLANIYLALVPRSVRFMIRSQMALVKDSMVAKLKNVIQPLRTAKVASVFDNN
ncbi:hypothetical protein MPSEU_000515000 [Mayamaea pseudoterrestris]|nr:hypothetical protein MPSEU_000515000 [Mayamaea pseudoterrestris]